MNEQTLLQRLYTLECGGDSLTPQERLEESLRHHLTMLLNTRRGSVPIAPEYGIADVTDLGRSFNEESIQEFKSELERIIMQYEPRLRSVNIRYSTRSDTPLAAVFELEGIVLTNDGAHKLHFETRLESGGSVRINSEREFDT